MCVSDDKQNNFEAFDSSFQNTKMLYKVNSIILFYFVIRVFPN